MEQKYIKKFQAIKNLINKEDPIIVEVGAHFCEDSLRFLEIFNNPIIYCFEPDPNNIKIIKKYISDIRIKLFEMAVSDSDSKNITFYQTNKPIPKNDFFLKYNWIDRHIAMDLNLGSSGASSLKQGHPLLKGSNKIKVNTIRMDTWINNNNINEIDLIWIDTQGSEKDVINSFGNVSDKIKHVWVEYGEMLYQGALNRKQTINLLSNFGFSLVEELSSTSSKGDLCFVNKK